MIQIWTAIRVHVDPAQASVPLSARGDFARAWNPFGEGSEAFAGASARSRPSARGDRRGAALTARHGPACLPAMSASDRAHVEALYDNKVGTQCSAALVLHSVEKHDQLDKAAVSSAWALDQTANQFVLAQALPPDSLLF